jgi:hypothetical protein
MGTLKDFVVRYNELAREERISTFSKGDLMKMAYGETYRNVDSALPMGMLEEEGLSKDEYWHYVMDYNNNGAFGHLTDLFDVIAKKNPTIEVYNNMYELTDTLPILDAVKKYENQDILWQIKRSDKSSKYAKGSTVGGQIKEIVEIKGHNIKHIKNSYDDYWYFVYDSTPFEFETKDDAIKSLNDLIKTHKYASGSTIEDHEASWVNACMKNHSKEECFIIILKDSQFSSYVGKPKNEYTHNRLPKKAIVTKDSVNLTTYTPNTGRYLDTIEFTDPTKLLKYLNKNQIMAKGSTIKVLDTISFSIGEGSKRKTHNLSDFRKAKKMVSENQLNGKVTLKTLENYYVLNKSDFLSCSSISECKEKAFDKFAKGSTIKGFKKGDKVKTREGNIETVIRVNSNGNIETQENDYTHNPQTLELIPKHAKGYTISDVLNGDVKASNKYYGELIDSYKKYHKIKELPTDNNSIKEIIEDISADQNFNQSMRVAFSFYLNDYANIKKHGKGTTIEGTPIEQMIKRATNEKYVTFVIHSLEEIGFTNSEAVETCQEFNKEIIKYKEELVYPSDVAQKLKEKDNDKYAKGSTVKEERYVLYGQNGMWYLKDAKEGRTISSSQLGFLNEFESKHKAQMVLDAFKEKQYAKGSTVKGGVEEWSIVTKNEEEHFDNYADARDFWNGLSKLEKANGQFFRKVWVNGEEGEVEILGGKLYANGSTVKGSSLYKIYNTTAVESNINSFLHNLKLKDGFSNSMGTFTAKLTEQQLNQLIGLIIEIDKNNNVYITNSVNTVVYDSEERGHGFKSFLYNMSGKYANGGYVEGGSDDLSTKEKATMYSWIDSFLEKYSGDDNLSQSLDMYEEFAKKFKKNKEQTHDIIDSGWARSRGYYEKAQAIKKSANRYANGSTVKGGEYENYVNNIYERQSEYGIVQPLYSFVRENGYSIYDMQDILEKEVPTEKDAWGDKKYSKKSIRKMIGVISGKYANGSTVKGKKTAEEIYEEEQYNAMFNSEYGNGGNIGDFSEDEILSIQKKVEGSGQKVAISKEEIDNEDGGLSYGIDFEENTMWYGEDKKLRDSDYDTLSQLLTFNSSKYSYGKYANGGNTTSGFNYSIGGL